MKNAKYIKWHRHTVATIVVLVLSNSHSFVQADRTAPCNTGNGMSSTECGVDTTASGLGSTAVGVQADAIGSSSTAIGVISAASGNDTTAIGVNSVASGNSSTAIGRSATAKDTWATALGNGANAIESGSTALGQATLTSANNAIAVGGLAESRSVGMISLGFGAGRVNTAFNPPVTDSPQAVAIGTWSQIAGGAPGGIAIGGDVNDDGIGARAAAPGAIAIGADVVADKAHTMTVGVPIEVKRDDGTAQILIKENIGVNKIRSLLRMVCNTCTPGFMLRQNKPSNSTWYFRMRKNGDFIIDDPLTKTTEADFRSGGDLRIGGTLTQGSSRQIKTEIELIKSQDILEKLDKLPISQWSYKKDDGNVKHIGPMAEDFHALFKVGIDDKSISSIDTSGVALAAIKALKQENERLRVEKDKQVAALNERINEMQVQIVEVNKLKQMLSDMIILNNTVAITHVEGN